ncbi:threonine--tRNA ligase [Metabacillus idriensis]|uniref:threonine--tRNA ligase n=1 Tax=Metabacillus idriensis TaxID=324768 RepID=UPI002812D335|nr:threonine--tRNA ligase [Metabacillus idriensis]MDR0139638.1 threonine--tRNA ligase [Metabacillus idriensis]
MKNKLLLKDLASRKQDSEKVIGGKVNGKVVSLNDIVDEFEEVELLTIESDERRDFLNHTCAQVLAYAVKRLYKGAILGKGSYQNSGFYYEFQLSHSIRAEELPMIEQEMQNILGEKLEIERLELSYEKASALLSEKGEELKLELLHEQRENNLISFYKHGDFIDLYSGPQLPSAEFIKAFKLSAVSGSYWKGDKNNLVMQRISGIAFASKKELALYVKEMEELKKRDHRKIGKEMELFMFSEEAPGMPFFLPNGQLMRNELQNFLREIQVVGGYREVQTPLMMNENLWRQSGHWDHYHENMYFSDVDEAKFALKPMNCPGHMMIYKNQLYSYRDLPIRLAEFGQVHRHEYSGALNGLLRVRTFCQDDAHLFVRPDQIEDEMKSVLLQIDKVYRTFGFDYSVELSTRPLNSMGSDHLWKKAEQSLKQVLEDLHVPYQVNEGDGAFYGPKIDFHIKDALKRSHQCATVQLDFQMPEKFNLSYMDEKNEKQRPVVIHRAISGSLDRFLGILIEHFAGSFPLWLSPIQAVIVPVAEVHLLYAEKLKNELEKCGIRANIDRRSEKLTYKIRMAQKSRVPYMLVIGDQEIEKNEVNVRVHGGKSSEGMAIDQFMSMLLEKIAKRELG